MPTTYTYTKPKGTVTLSKLLNEIKISMSKKFYRDIDGETVDGYIEFIDDDISDNLKITSNTSLTEGELTSLNTIINNHTVDNGYVPVISNYMEFISPNGSNWILSIDDDGVPNVNPK